MGSTHSGSLYAFGKIPARADFVAIGISPATRRAWDSWLQDGLATCQQRVRRPLNEVVSRAPTWHFVLPFQVFGAATMIGVMLPSKDAVGRAYPLVLGVELPFPIDLLPLMAGSNRWFAALDALAFDALDPAFDPEEISRRVLPRWPVDRGTAAAGEPALIDQAGLAVELPMVSVAAQLARSLCGTDAMKRGVWWTAGNDMMGPMLAISPSLPSPEAFVALLAGGWASHGWQVRPLAHEAGGIAGLSRWDRKS